MFKIFWHSKTFWSIMEKYQSYSFSGYIYLMVRKLGQKVKWSLFKSQSEKSSFAAGRISHATFVGQAKKKRDLISNPFSQIEADPGWRERVRELGVSRGVDVYKRSVTTYFYIFRSSSLSLLLKQKEIIGHILVQLTTIVVMLQISLLRFSYRQN